MAFHVACPITCRRICSCSIGFARSIQGEKDKNGFLEEIVRIEEFLRVREFNTVQVAVPKIVPPPPPAVVVAPAVNLGDAEELLSVQTKRAAMQTKAEDNARRFESVDVVDLAGEEQGQSNVKVMCRLCFSGENEGSDRDRKMLSCKTCGKKYHRLCLKAWAQHRDLFHWSSWTCPSCRICEVCRRIGDPNKFMFCKRCDGAYHCYCQQPAHKNVSNGPYLCPKHTKCHSCESTVPGNGLSVRWFLRYTFCDACGRLFVKGNYCPVCLKVYRDSESTPMVCCDFCWRWVHCQCDGISDEKYMQFHVDENLQYKCTTCCGECYQVRDLEDAVRELWSRRDEADRDLIASLRAAAGLPTQEEIFSISPYSDDEDSGPSTLNNEYGRSLKFSLKGVVDKSPKKSKDYGKQSSIKYGKKKGHQTSLTGKAGSHHNFEGHIGLFPYPVAGNLTEGVCSINQSGVSRHKFFDEVTATNENRTVQIKSNRPHGLDTGRDIGQSASKSKITKGPKLVIHLGGGNRTTTNSTMSDGSSCQKEQDLTTSNGSEDMGQQQRVNHKKLGDGKVEKMDFSVHVKGSKLKGRKSSMIKIKEVNPEVSEANPKFGLAKMGDTYEPDSQMNTHVLLGKRSTEKASSLKYAEGRPDGFGDLKYDSKPLLKDPKPLLKLKFKNPYYENQSFLASQLEAEKSLVKGQRSKRKRPSPLMEKTLPKEEDANNSEGEIMDANWILLKLGKGAIGKRVEVHQPSNNSWHKGTVREEFEGTSMVSVALDEGGRSKILDLGKQGIRFASEKRKALKS